MKKKLHSAAILGIDSISRLGIAYSGRKECFFFDDILLKKILKNSLLKEEALMKLIVKDLKIFQRKFPQQQ